MTAADPRQDHLRPIIARLSARFSDALVLAAVLHGALRQSIGADARVGANTAKRGEELGRH